MIKPCEYCHSPPESDSVGEDGFRLPLVLSDDLLAPAFRGPELSDDAGSPSYVNDGMATGDTTSTAGVTTTVVTGFLDAVAAASAFFVDGCNANVTKKARSRLR
jgi:hypothetical protein